MTDQKKPEAIADDDLDAAQGGILTTNENITEFKAQGPKTAGQIRRMPIRKGLTSMGEGDVGV